MMKINKKKRFKGMLIFFKTSMFIIEVFVAVCLVYDLTFASSGLMGQQNYGQRTKFEIYLEKINFRGRTGLFGLRTMALLCIIVCSYYGDEGERTDVFTFRDHILYPFSVEYDDESYIQILSSPKIIFKFIAILFVLSLIRECVSHPWISTIATSTSYFDSGNEPQLGILTKVSTFVLTVNTLGYCFAVALNLKKIFDETDISPEGKWSYDFEEGQIFFLMIVLTFVIAWKYVRSVLTNRTSYYVAVYFLFYAPFYHFFFSFCGLEYNDQPLIQKIIMYLMIFTYALNIAYVLIGYCLRTVKNVLKWELRMVLVTGNLSLIITTAFSVLLISAFLDVAMSFSQNWFEFTYTYRFETVDQSYIPMLPLIDSINHEGIHKHIQNVFAAIPLASVFLAVMYTVFDRKYTSFRVGHFWMSFGLFSLNVSCFLGLFVVQSTLDSLKDAPFVSIDFLEENVDQIEAGIIKIIAAMGLDMLSCLISPAGLNITNQPVENPVYVPKGKIKPKSTHELSIQSIVNLLPDKSSKNHSSVIVTFVFLVVYTIFLTATAVSAFKDEWLVLILNSHPLLNIGEGLPELEGAKCVIDTTGLTSIVDGLEYALNISFPGPLTTEDLVSDQDKVCIVAGLFIFLCVTAISFILFIGETRSTNPKKVMLLSNSFVLPCFIFILFLPSLVESALPGVFIQLRVDPGITHAFYAFMGHIIFMVLIVLEMIPIASVKTEEAKLKLHDLELKSKNS